MPELKQTTERDRALLVALNFRSADRLRTAEYLEELGGNDRIANDDLVSGRFLGNDLGGGFQLSCRNIREETCPALRDSTVYGKFPLQVDPFQ